mmetsp:Transcript_21423/g.24621  ORF Transcript_21423/g.24621 Transcript_21423/m.24621 type:complete len:400 (+) Transcript_21423:2-1201(+)
MKSNSMEEMKTNGMIANINVERDKDLGRHEDHLIRSLSQGSPGENRDKINSSEEMDSNYRLNAEKPEDEQANVDDVATNISETHTGYNFLMFVAAAEKGNKVAEVLLKGFIKKEDRSKIENFEFDSREYSVMSTEIINRALAHILKTTAVESLRYLLTYCKNKFIFPMVEDTSVAELIRNFETRQCRDILRLLLTHEIIIEYSDSEVDKMEMLAQGVKEISNATSLTRGKPNAKIKPYEQENVKDALEADLDLDKEDQKIGGEGNDSSTMQSVDSSGYEYEILKPKRFTNSGEYMKREHVAEIMFRSLNFSSQKEIEAIRRLYGSFDKIRTKDIRLIKLLTLYDRFDIFCEIMKAKAKEHTKVIEDDDELSFSFLNDHNKPPEKVAYSTEEIILDAVGH